MDLTDQEHIEAAPALLFRVNNRKYLFKGKVCVWNGTEFSCEHGRRKAQCKECGGSAICEHGRRKAQCKECGGSAICEHGKQKEYCKECGGSAICEHGRRKAQCKECGGSAICEHGTRKAYCKECGGSAICEHGKRKRECKECGGSAICEHGKQKRQCKECVPLSVMVASKWLCSVCGAHLNRTRHEVGLCAQCDQTQHERMEHRARRLLLSYMPAPYDSQAGWSALDSQLIGSESCATARRRPDMMIELEDRVVGFEIDEDSHASRALSCETAKLDDHRWGAAAVGCAAKPAVCVRLNPDPRGPNDTVSLEERCRLAAEQLLHYAWCPLTELHAMGTVVVYVCYGANGNKHIEEARKHPHFRVIVVS